MPGPVRVTSFRHDGAVMKMCATQLHDNRTMLPVALLALFDEQRRMHRARQLVAQVPAIVPLGAYVDGLFYQGPPEADRALRALAEAEQYEHIEANVFKFKEGSAWRQVPQCAQQSSHNRECFKPRLRLSWDTCDTERNLEARLAAKPLDGPELAEKARFNEMVSSGQALPLSDVSYAIVASAIANEGMLCLAPAGCGKSVLLRQIKAVLEGLQHKVRVCAYTHAACRMVNGETVAHLLHLNGSLADTWFLVDEVGLLPLVTLGAMSRWQFLGARFIFFGDYEGQFEPFRDRWNMDMRNGDNDLMHQLCNGYHMTQTYRRGTDPELFSWYHAMYGQEDARGLANESRARYGAECDPRCNPLVLCLSHKKRMRINALQNERLKPEGALHCVCEGEDLCGTTMQPQSMHVWLGLELIGCPRGTGKQRTVQGVLYAVTNIGEDALELQMLPEYRHGASDEKVSVPLDEVCAQLRLAHAMCYYTVQGRTVRDRHIVLLDIEHQHFSVRALIVGLSRATHGRWLHVGDSDSEALFGGARVVRQRRA